MNPVLEIHDLRVLAPGGQALVDGVSLRLAAGEVLALIGESGAGKSTVGLAAFGYTRGQCRIAGGQVRLAGCDLLGAGAAQLRALRGSRIAYVAQSAAAAFNPALSIDAQVIEAPLRHGLMARAAALAWARELYAALDLPDPERIGRRHAHQLSGGQLQRAMLAMALSCRPALLVLDEPTSALDVSTQIEVLLVLRKVVREFGCAALFISHDLALVAQIADRVLVLRAGKPVEHGSCAALLAAPRQQYTQQLLAERGAAPLVAAQPVQQPALLTVRGLTAGYGNAAIVRGLDLTLARGETLALIGESGSGKSTLARALAGLTGLQGGALVFSGAPLPARLQERTREHKRRIQLIYQMPDLALNPRQSIGEIIGRPLAFYFGLDARARRARVLELLQLTGLPAELITRRPEQLSGGQKQRVCIARALAAQPDLVICDEVTSALDPLVASGILELLAALQQRMGLSYLFITHDLRTVRRVAHRVAVLLRGELIACGHSAQVFSAPMHPYTARLLAAVPQMHSGWLDDARAHKQAQQEPTPGGPPHAAAGQ